MLIVPSLANAFREILQLKSIKPQYSPKISYYTFSANMNGFKCISRVIIQHFNIFEVHAFSRTQTYLSLFYILRSFHNNLKINVKLREKKNCQYQQMQSKWDLEVLLALGSRHHPVTLGSVFENEFLNLSQPFFPQLYKGNK